MTKAIGRHRWAISEGYIPSESSFSDRARISHETACILNADDRDAHIEITIFFADREPVGPYRVNVAPCRTLHLRFNDLNDPQPIPRDTDYASLIESDVPIVVQHTRLDSRNAETGNNKTKIASRRHAATVASGIADREHSHFFSGLQCAVHIG